MMPINAHEDHTAPLRSALYLDLDNVYITLREEEKVEVANRFAMQPARWLQWLEQGMPGLPTTEIVGRRRRILVRNVYLNPLTREIASLRQHFTHAGFRVVDCPSITRQGKNAADILMTIDIVDALAHPAQYEEFIIFSADSDFAPVLRRLRENNRRTVVVSVGQVSPAYVAGCDLMIYGNDLVKHGIRALPARPDVARVVPATPAYQPQTALMTQSPHENGDLKAGIADYLRNMLIASDRPLGLALVGSRLHHAFGDKIKSSGWAGYGNLTSFLASLTAPGIACDLTTRYLYDPARHEVPNGKLSSTADSTVVGADGQPPVFDDNDNDKAVEELAHRVRLTTGAPALRPRDYAAVFQAAARQVTDWTRGNFSLNEAVRAVKDDCRSQFSCFVGTRDITFILRGISFCSPVGDPPDARAMANAFQQNVLNLCAREQLELGDEERAGIARWLTSGLNEQVTEAAPDTEADRQLAYEFGGQLFGAYTQLPQSMPDFSGVFIIGDFQPDDSWFLIDVGEGEHLSNVLTDPDSRAQWQGECTGRLVFLIFRAPEDWTPQQRVELVDRIRNDGESV